MKNIILIYDYFTPAWKAGGPIRSIEQLILGLSSEYNFYVLCSAFDYGEMNLLDNIIPDQWNDWSGIAKVYYNSSHKPGFFFFKSLFNEINPDIILINGIYSLYYNINPLIAGISYKKKYKCSKILLSPRGMLHSGALAQKRYKKVIFLMLFKMLGLQKNILWHATDEKEVHFIRTKFKYAHIAIAGNFPKLYAQLPTPVKESGKLIMGTLALISPMKNHLEILKALQSIKQQVIWHIYGPVKDQAFWNLCSIAINELPSNIQVIYHGAIPPDQVSTVLKIIQVFILPSKSENFGHAIIEALSAGKPVITTNTTPFTNLDLKKAGYTLFINDLQSQLIHAIHDFAAMDQETFSQYQKSAIQYANNFVDIEKLKNQYRDIF